MIKIAKINNKTIALYAGMALFSVVWAAPPQQDQRPELAPQALKQIQALQEEKAARTPTQRKNQLALALHSENASGAGDYRKTAYAELQYQYQH